MQNRKYLGKWELGCLVFLVCTVRLFTSYPNIRGVSSLWLSTLIGGILFLGLLFLALRLVNLSRPPHKIISAITALYWLIAAALALKEGTAVLHQVSYFRSPNWFLSLFLLLGAIVPPLCGGRSVYRMHSLLVLPIAVCLVIITFFGLSDARMNNLAPWLGNGGLEVMQRSFSSLLIFMDVPFLLLLIPRCRPEVPIRKTVFFSAAAGVAVTVFVMLAASLRHPHELYTAIPLYAMAKTGVGTEALYLLSFLVALMLYLSLALHLIACGIRPLKNKFSKRQTVALLALLLCLTLSGCYDSREVEETAYLIGLGIDKGESAMQYTFQISNPLEMGKTSQKESEEPPPEAGEDANKGVNNMTIEAENFYLALSELRSYLGKEPDVSHLKVIAFSKELARDGLLPHAETLFAHREIRPDTNLCLAESASDFLTKVKPTLEQSTARYYELLFWRRYSPYAPVSELEDFVTACLDTGKDPVLPLANGEQISGMGIFQDGVLVAEADGKKAMLYKLLSGKGSDITVAAGDSVFSVSSRGTPNISVSPNQSPPRITVSPRLRATLLEGSAEDRSRLAAQLDEDMTALLRESAALSADILGCGSALRASCQTEEDWRQRNWANEFKKASIFTKTTLNLEK